jgi:hypothetical protein
VVQIHSPRPFPSPCAASFAGQSGRQRVAARLGHRHRGLRDFPSAFLRRQEQGRQRLEQAAGSHRLGTGHAFLPLRAREGRAGPGRVGFAIGPNWNSERCGASWRSRDRSGNNLFKRLLPLADACSSVEISEPRPGAGLPLSVAERGDHPHTGGAAPGSPPPCRSTFILRFSGDILSPFRQPGKCYFGQV